MLQAQRFRASRLVTDTGIHAMGWSEDQAVRYMNTTGRLPLQHGVQHHADGPGALADSDAALALFVKMDYANAEVPMLPVVASARRVGLESVVFAWLTLLSSLAALLTPANGSIRLDDIVEFHALTREQLSEIVELQVARDRQGEDDQDRPDDGVNQPQHQCGDQRRGARNDGSDETTHLPPSYSSAVPVSFTEPVADPLTELIGLSVIAAFTASIRSWVAT